MQSASAGVVLMLLAFAASLLPAQPRVVSMQQAMTLAAENNPELRIASLEV